MSKPEPIRVAAEGIEAKPVTMNTDPQPNVNWRRVAQLPSFQMFVCEQAPPPSSQDPEQWATAWAAQYVQRKGSGELYNEYAAWHENKGYWPNETPLGELKE